MRNPCPFAVLTLVVGLGALPVEAAEVGPENGSLVIAGGGIRDTSIYGRFLDLAGGPKAPIVVIPTAIPGDDFNDYWPGLRALRAAGAENLKVLHTRDREVANSQEFVRPLRQAGGVWFTGGRQWRLAEAYLHTRTHTELQALLRRGGVIGGSSAGATIQGAYLVRGDTQTNTIMMGDHEEGFGFLKLAAIDQHLLRRNRHFDLIEVIEAHPQLLGIGLDENTAIVVRGDSFEVIGQSYVAIYDHASQLQPRGRFYFLAPGDRFDLANRRASRLAMSSEPFHRVRSGEWSEP